MSTFTMPDEAERDAIDTRHFDEGVTHTVKLLAKALGITEWEEGDGSEDYDCDLTTTLMNILEAKGLYSSEDGSWARLRGPEVPAPQQEVAVTAGQGEK